MKKFWIILGVVLVIAFFVGIVLWQKKQDVRPFNHFDFPETVKVENTTEYRADTICMVLVNKVFDLDTLNLIIVYIPVVNTGDNVFYGIVQMAPFKTNQFVLLLKKGMSLTKLKEVLSHEFVHVEQYVSGDLVLWGDSCVYKGEEIILNGYNKDVPFEKDAFDKQKEINKELKELLYGTN